MTTITTGGTAYDLSGPDRAPAVVLIHGLGLTRGITWQGITPVLAQRFRVLSYDLCGHGETALPCGPVSLTTLSEQLIALMNAVGIKRAALVGFSLGGMINRRCAIDHPQRVSALGILNAPHDRGDALQRKVEQQARDAAAGGPAATIDAALDRWFTPGFRSAGAETVARVRDTVLANDPENYAAHRQVLAEGVTDLIRPDPPIAHPALVMTCEGDSGSTPQMSHAITREIAGAETVIVPALKHLGLLERPALFTGPLMAFLNRVAD